MSKSDEGIEVTVGSATLLVTKDGRLSAKMPLHDFEDGRVNALYFDHDRDARQVRRRKGFGPAVRPLRR